MRRQYAILTGVIAIGLHWFYNRETDINLTQQIHPKLSAKVDVPIHRQWVNYYWLVASQYHNSLYLNRMTKENLLAIKKREDLTTVKQRLKR